MPPSENANLSVAANVALEPSVIASILIIAATSPNSNALAPEFIRRGMEVIERYGLIVIFILVLIASPVIAPIMQAVVQGLLSAFQVVFRM